MKSFFLLLLGIIIAAVIAVQIFENGVSRGMKAASHPSSTPAASGDTPAEEKRTPDAEVFHGPSDVPHIIGPRADPPNY
jgi:hypothetical protein